MTTSHFILIFSKNHKYINHTIILYLFIVSFIYQFIYIFIHLPIYSSFLYLLKCLIKKQSLLLVIKIYFLSLFYFLLINYFYYLSYTLGIFLLSYIQKKLSTREYVDGLSYLFSSNCSIRRVRVFISANKPIFKADLYPKIRVL